MDPGYSVDSKLLIVFIDDDGDGSEGGWYESVGDPLLVLITPPRIKKKVNTNQINASLTKSSLEI